jgi:hypothetical protein
MKFCFVVEAQGNQDTFYKIETGPSTLLVTNNAPRSAQDQSIYDN